MPDVLQRVPNVEMDKSPILAEGNGQINVQRDERVANWREIHRKEEMSHDGLELWVNDEEWIDNSTATVGADGFFIGNEEDSTEE